MKITLHRGDIPSDIDFGDSVAIDTEAMGLNHIRDRLCVVQLSAGDGTAHVVQLKADEYDAPNLKKLLTDPKVLKIFHFGRFDIAAMWMYLDVITAPVYCTKIASKMARTFTNHHSLKTLCKNLLDIDTSKQQQCTDWGADELSEKQVQYAASDVLYLHQIKEELDKMLIREERMELTQACFDFLPARSLMDVAGWGEVDIFAHSS